MDLIDLITTRRFLGNEFMLWLWFKCECFEARLALPNHGSVEVWFDDQLTLEAYLAETERNDFRGGSPAYSPEAKTALRQGKRPSKAKLGVIKEGREWQLTLKAEELSLSGVKIPALLSKEEEEQFYERMYLLEELEEILDDLFHEFLALRLDPAFHEHIFPAIRAWIERDDVATPESYPTDAVAHLIPAAAEGAEPTEDADDQDEVEGVPEQEAS